MAGYDRRMIEMLEQAAETRGILRVLEGDFEDGYEEQPFFTKALDDGLVRYTKGASQGVFIAIHLLPAGWALLGKVPPQTFLGKISAAADLLVEKVLRPSR